MTGFTLGQEYGFGRTQQSQILPGFGGYPDLATGAGYSFTLQNYDRWRLVFCTFTLTTGDDSAGGRYVTLEYPAGNGNSETADGASVLVSDSSTQRYIGQYRRGPAEWNTGTDVWFPLSGLWLEVGRTINLNIANVQADDQLSEVSFTFDRTPVQDDGTVAERTLTAENYAQWGSQTGGPLGA